MVRLSRFLSGVFVFLLSATASAQQPADRLTLPGIYGDDDRRVIEDKGPPWSAIGRVNRRIGGFCSGTLVAPDKVLTAAHCLWNQRLGKWIASGDLHFLAGYRLGEYVAHRGVKAMLLPPGIRVDERGHPRDMTTDWAVLTLDQPLPPSPALRPIALARGSEIGVAVKGTRLIRAGYSQDRPHLPTSVICQVVGRSGAQLLLHDCDATFGDSGSPFLVETSAGWRVLGVQIATVAQRQRAFGVAILAAGLPTD